VTDGLSWRVAMEADLPDPPPPTGLRRRCTAARGTRPAALRSRR